MGKGPSKVLWSVALGYVLYTAWLLFLNPIIPLNIEFFDIHSPDITGAIAIGWAGFAVGIFFAEFTRRKEP